MPIELTCPSCGKQLRLADEHAGKAGRCPACQATFQIPAHGQPQMPANPFGGPAPPQPFGAPPTPTPPGDLFGGPGPQQPPNPFASTGNMQSPYGGTNPYTAPQTPNMYGAQSSSGEGMATASTVLGVVSIVFSFVQCCCLNLLIGLPCGLIGLVLSFQVPPDRRKVGMILNIVGLALNLLITLAWWALQIAWAANQPQFNPQFNP